MQYYPVEIGTHVKYFVLILIAVMLVANFTQASSDPSAGTAATSAGASAAYLHYLADGRVAKPQDYREWAFLTSGVDMTYSVGMTMDQHEFDNVFVEPNALRVFQATGTWPDGTVIAKEDREGRTEGSINKGGEFQTTMLDGLELHVKDSARFKGGWAFFAFGGDAPVPQISLGASCYRCHSAHAAVDTTFVQFYPTLIGIAKAKKTLSAGYLRDSAQLVDGARGGN